MSLHRIVVLVAAGIAFPALAQEEIAWLPSGLPPWKPATGPLITRWAADAGPDRAHPEYPRPTLVREDWLSLNGVWQVGLAPDGAGDSPKKPDWHLILVPFPIESALSGVMRQASAATYLKTFEIPASWAGRRVMLHFGAVDFAAVVSVNGKRLGEHTGGYDAFSFDVTDALKPAGPQELTVEVTDPTDTGTQARGKQVRKPGGIFYTPVTGIWQTVWLEPVPETRIDGLAITPDIDKGEVRVKLDWSLVPASHVAEFTVLDGERTVDVSTRGPSGGDTATIAIPGAKLWSPDSPHLYNLRIRLVRQAPGEHPPLIDDEAMSYFGMRKIALGKDDRGATRLFLNNKPCFMVGPLDQGFWPDGIYTAPSDEALRADVETMKRLGFNMVRKHVKVEPETWYTWCDRLGLLVWQDMPSGDAYIGPSDPDLTRSPESAAQFETELEQLVREKGNHPSIVMWVVFNEGWGQYDTARLADAVRTLDPTRLVNSASGWTDRGVGDVHDVHVYPGPGMPPVEPARAAVLGEFGGLGLAVAGHTWSKESWGYRGVADAEDLAWQYGNLMRQVYELRDQGLCAAVYTQLTDVETECNGLLTYDRVMKADPALIEGANRGKFAPMVTVLPASIAEPAVWRYTFDAPAADWADPAFDDSSWQEGPAGFGTKGTPGAIVRTEWNGEQIWMRRHFDLPAVPRGQVMLNIHHDEAAEVFINGVAAATLAGYTTGYGPARISPEARATLKAGRNTIAIRVTQTAGGQYIDAGLIALEEPKP